jgi:hypothetical protein
VGEGRALVPVVGKALEVGLVVVLVGLLTTALFGSVVPGYRTTVGEEVGERTLQRTADEVTGAAAAADGHDDAVTRVDVALPATIRGRTYRVVGAGDALVLRHAHPDVGGRARLALPAGVDVAGTWHSDRETLVRVVARDGTAAVELVSR